MLVMVVELLLMYVESVRNYSQIGEISTGDIIHVVYGQSFKEIRLFTSYS